MREPLVPNLSPCGRALRTCRLYGHVAGRMQDPLTRAYRYRKVSAEFSTLAKRTSSDFSRGYYHRMAVQYQTLADGDWDGRMEMRSCQRRSPCSLPKCGLIESNPARNTSMVFLNNGSRARIDFLEGMTTRQSFVALCRALNEKLEVSAASQQ